MVTRTSILRSNKFTTESSPSVNSENAKSHLSLSNPSSDRISDTISPQATTIIKTVTGSSKNVSGSKTVKHITILLKLQYNSHSDLNLHYDINQLF